MSNVNNIINSCLVTQSLPLLGIILYVIFVHLNDGIVSLPLWHGVIDAFTLFGVTILRMTARQFELALVVNIVTTKPCCVAVA